ncbi:kinesin family member 4/7/21/27 [Angomonas deanei]|uniref:Kinesin-like protein n=1 Tax=Angomonas deanei TaxID=59799 RepID=A0A7G2CM83_9TRYP|nr:kinesin family member 4/7/21/27 [Angomonas deanei]CAD2220535.1 Kinesin motor domain containing protein, putative [Angomonas deanei]|eukprot:EPY21705.1 kinesin family member 4/7/21/27 [Angomonas deanei]
MSALTADVIQEVFCRLAEEDSASDAKKEYTVKVSALEVYNETLTDLLAQESGRKASTAHNNLQLREDPKGGVYVPGLVEREVATEGELMNLVDRATSNRKTASTLMNATSSRSHCVVTLLLEKRGVLSKFCFIDLAGSERLKRSIGLGEASSNSSQAMFGEGSSNNVLDRMKEGISINGGLLALGNVIVALCEKKPHVPYRSSKLTRLLQPMLSGNSRTAMIACVSPHASSLEESLNTLKYADRAKSIKTDPRLVITRFDSYDEAERTILALRKEVEELRALCADSKSSTTPKETPAERKVSAVELDERVRELQSLLEKEQSVTKRLEDDLFKAEYTTMVEIEKRKALEERVAELEGTVSANYSYDEDSRHASPAIGKRAQSAVGRQSDEINDSYQKRLMKLEQERDNLEALKAQHIADSQRLTLALREGDVSEEESEFHRARVESEERQVQLLEQEVASKKKMIAGLELERDAAVNRLALYEKELSKESATKSHLEEELMKAAAQLEASEMVMQQKEEERKRLNETYKARIRRAEEKAVEYKRRVKQAELEVKMRTDEIERTKQLQERVETLKEELSKQRSNTRAEQRKVQHMNAAHSQEMNAMQRHVREAADEIAKLQAKLARKEDEIIRTRRKINVQGNETEASRKFERRNTYTNYAQSGDSSMVSSANLQKEIEYELKILERFEKDLAELQKYREALQQAQSMDAPKWSRAIMGYEQRLSRVEMELGKTTIPNSVRDSLTAEKTHIENTLNQLSTVKSMFDEAAAQLIEFDSRIDSMNEARRFHLHRVRDLQNRLNQSKSEAAKQKGKFSRQNTSISAIQSKSSNNSRAWTMAIIYHPSGISVILRRN